MIDGNRLEPSDTFGEILACNRSLRITVFASCLAAPAHPGPPANGIDVSDVVDINDLMGARQRAEKVESMTLQELRQVPGLEPLIAKYTSYSIRDLRTLMTSKSTIDYRKHTNLIAIGQFLNLVHEGEGDEDTAASTLVTPEKVKLFCSKLRALPHKSISKKKKCDYISSVYNDMDESVVAEPGCMGTKVTREAIERARAILSKVRTEFHREYVAEGNGCHYQSEWVRMGKWLTNDEWHTLRKRVEDELEVMRPYTKKEAYWYQSLLIVSICMNGGGLRSEVINNLYVDDVVPRTSGLALRIVSEKTTTKDYNLKVCGKRSTSTEVRPSNVQRTVPVPLGTEMVHEQFLRRRLAQHPGPGRSCDVWPVWCAF